MTLQSSSLALGICFTLVTALNGCAGDPAERTSSDPLKDLGVDTAIGARRDPSGAEVSRDFGLVDSLGNKISYSMGPDGMVDKITDSVGRVTTLTHNADRQAQRDFRGRSPGRYLEPTHSQRSVTRHSRLARQSH